MAACATDNLSLTYADFAQFDKGLEMALEEMRLEPESPYSYQLLAFAYHNNNRLQEAKAVAKNLASDDIHRILFVLASERKDQAAMNHEMEVTRGTDDEAYLLAEQATYQSGLGKLKDSAATMAKAVSVAEKGSNTEFAARVEAELGWYLALAGDCTGARAAVQSSLHRFPTGINRGPASFAFASCGDDAKALSLFSDLSRDYPSATMLNAKYGPALQAEIHLHKGKFDEALSILGPVKQLEMGMGPGGPYTTAYVRGVIYLKKGDSEHAAGEFQRILDNRHLRSISIFIPLARLQLARSYVLQKDTAKAKTTYQDFLADWKDADPDILILKQAKAEYAKLQ